MKHLIMGEYLYACVQIRGSFHRIESSESLPTIGSDLEVKFLCEYAILYLPALSRMVVPVSFMTNLTAIGCRAHSTSLDKGKHVMTEVTLKGVGIVEKELLAELEVNPNIGEALEILDVFQVHYHLYNLDNEDILIGDAIVVDRHLSSQLTALEMKHKTVVFLEETSHGSDAGFDYLRIVAVANPDTIVGPFVLDFEFDLLFLEDLVD